MKKYYYPDDRIAVVSMGAIFPDAHDTKEFWLNILERKVSITELPDSIVNSKLYYRPEVYKKIYKKDKTYTRMGSMVDMERVLAVGKKFKIPPAVAEYMDPNQHGAIYCVDQALQSLRGRPLSKERTAVILSGGNPAEFNERAIERSFFSIVEENIRNNPIVTGKLDPEELESVLQEVSVTSLEKTLPFTEDTTTGFMQNLIPGRVSNVFDFQGPSFLVDAACASSMVSVIVGVQGLLSKEYDAVIAGGIDFGLNASRLAVFSAINALSPNGSFPFDVRANGFVMGQGGGVVILKRLEDALKDNDDIIALISGYGQGSDGKGKYIAAPDEEGEARVIQQACKKAGYPVDTIELIEAHGTGTTVGDVVEVNALKKAFSSLNVTKKNYCGIGSVKSNIGHLKAAAGAPGMIKAVLALYHKTLPPTANVQQINPKIKLENSPFYVLTEKKSWFEHNEHPRRANVSAFGFGGADYHIAMEEYRPEFYHKVYPVPSINEEITDRSPQPLSKPFVEAVFFCGATMEALSASYRDFQAKAHSPASNYNFTQHVFNHNAQVSAGEKVRLAVCASSYDELAEKWRIFEEQQKDGARRIGETEALAFSGIFYSNEPVVSSEEIAFIFPGQASQYPNMCKELPAVFPAVRSFYTQVDALWQAQYGHPISALLFGEDEAALEEKLKNTKNTHPAMFLSCAGIYKLLSESGIKADYFVGHSLGEMTALYAGEMLDLGSALRVIGARGYCFDTIPEKSRGKLMSIKAGEEEVKVFLNSLDLKIYVANLNAPEQTVVGGFEEEIERLDQYLTEKKVLHTVLNVSHAFHTPLIVEAAEKFQEEISDTRFSLPRVKIVANHLQKYYPRSQKSLKDMPEILKDQITSAVRFGDSIRMLYQKGVRVFVEVGPSTVMTNLVRQILPDRDIRVIATCPKRKDAAEAYYKVLAEMFVLGIPVRMVPSVLDLTNSLSTFSTADGEESYSLGRRSMVDKIKMDYPPAHQEQESLVYSGVSLGLPGSFKKIFEEENFEHLIEGRNFIEKLTDEDLAKMLDLNITRLVKKEESSVFKRLTSVNELIRLAGKFGELNMLEDYQVDEETLEQMTSTICAGVAAGYEALKDAGIPLVREWVTTSSGSKIPGRLLLPEEMRNDTGVIFANCFVMVEPFVREVSKYIASRYGGKTKQDLIEFYETLVLQVSNAETKKQLTDWFALNYSRLNLGEGEIYEFNNDFITQYTSLANNRLAQFIGASGPNFHLSAACSSTAYAVTVAESLIRTGQAGRVIVIGAENPTSKTVLPWFAGSFLTSGAATTASNLYEAAVPFDNRRNGMILGAGAVGIVIEKEKEVEARGMNGICRLMGTHSFNMAGHQSRIDSKKFSVELDRFISKMEDKHRIDRKSMAPKTLYFSHETYTPKKGGCSQTEKAALQTTFGEQYREIMVTNTKGMTGHTIGASIEEAVAAKSLQYQKAPPIVNYKEPDPELEGLKLSKGGSHSFDYVLRMVAGFGGQGNYILMQKIASGDRRISDVSSYQSWLERITDARGTSKNTKLGMEGRILVALGDMDDENCEPRRDQTPSYEKERTMGSEQASAQKINRNNTVITSVTGEESLIDQILEIYSNVTKYPKEMLDLNMEMEADLGIDTVKQATIFAMIAEKFHLEEAAEIQLSNYPRIGDVIDLVSSKTGFENQDEVAVVSGLAHNEVEESFQTIDEQEIVEAVLKVVSEVTKYPMDMLDLDMEMEADLGIDTVKQATIISYLTERYPLQLGEGPQISELSNIRKIVYLVRESISGDNSKSSEIKHTPAKARVRDAITETAPSVGTGSALQVNDNRLNPDRVAGERVNPPIALADKKGGIEEGVLEIIAEVTKYPMEMLESDMEMEADLGIDTVKQATIFSILSERFGMADDQTVNISEYKTIGAVVEFVQNLMGSEAPSAYNKIEPVEDAQEAVVSGESEGPADKPQNDLCYQTPVAVEAEAPPKDFSIKEKNIWIIGSYAEGVDKVATVIGQETIRARAQKVETIVLSAPVIPEKLAAQIEEMTAQPVSVLIDCGDLGRTLVDAQLSPEEEKQLLYLNSEARFLFYKILQEKLDQDLRIVCTVSLDGLMGYGEPSSKLINPYSSALSGFYKGLRKEWKDASVKILDLNVATLKDLDKRVVTKIINEVESGGDDYEIAYSGNTRMTIKLEDLDLAEMKPVKLPKEPHILITGGANGISAEIALGLAKEVKGKYTLIGRTVLPENIAELSGMKDDRLNQVRLEIQESLRATKKRVTPLMVQKEFEKITKAVSAYRTIQRIERTGSKVTYFSCDVTDSKKLKSVIGKAVKVYGPVDGLIHGAGIEKSHMLADKSSTEFKEVFSVKAEGIWNLSRIVDLTQLKVLIGFSSISGRFGNEAQLDYCAANSFLGSYIRMLKNRYPHLHALGIDWSGWKDVGMAWRNEFVKNHAEEAGVHLIEPSRGVAALTRVFINETNCSQVVISKGLKDFAGSRLMDENLTKIPMIDWVTRKNGVIEKAYKIISVKKDPIIDQHRLRTTPLLPAVAIMEICAEYYSLLFGRKDHYCFRDLSFMNQLKLFHDNSQEVFIEHLSDLKSDTLEVALRSYFTPKLGEPRLITHGRLVIGDKLGDFQEMMKYTQMLQGELTEVSFEETDIKNSKLQSRNNLNFGPLFVDKKSAANRIAYNINGAVYSYTVPREQLENKDYHLKDLLVNPCVLDTLFQAAALHSLMRHERIHLPVSADEVGVIRVPKQIENLKIIAHLNRYDKGDGLYDMIMIDAQGDICYYMKNVTLRRINL